MMSALIHDPNVTFLLFVVALIGLYVEISHPGVIFPGVTGGIALLLFFLAAGSLSPNWVGLALMAFAFVLLVLDVRLPSHGVLTVGAVTSTALLPEGRVSYQGEDWMAIVLVLLLLLFSAIRVVQQYERGVIFVLGRLIGAKGPGIFL